MQLINATLQMVPCSPSLFLMERYVVGVGPPGFQIVPVFATTGSEVEIATLYNYPHSLTNIVDY